MLHTLQNFTLPVFTTLTTKHHNTPSNYQRHLCVKFCDMVVTDLNEVIEIETQNLGQMQQLEHDSENASQDV